MNDHLLFPLDGLAGSADPNPMIRRHGRGPDGRTCRQCRHAVAADTYWKCRRRSVSRSHGTDHRLWWNACRLFEEDG